MWKASIRIRATAVAPLRAAWSAPQFSGRVALHHSADGKLVALTGKSTSMTRANKATADMLKLWRTERPNAISRVGGNLELKPLGTRAGWVQLVPNSIGNRTHGTYDTVRWNSSSMNEKDDANRPSTLSNAVEDTGSEPNADAHKAETLAEPETSHTSSASSRLASVAAATTQQLEKQVKRVLGNNDLNHSDLVSVVLIALFTVILMASPFAAQHMKQQAARHGGYDDRLQTDDPVDEFARLARREWQLFSNADDDRDDGNAAENANVVELLLKDVFKSTALQHAAQDFVVQVMQSDRFKEAAIRLVKELWSDLVTDPETIAQVVKLLVIVIQNPAVKQAVIELVLEIATRDPVIRAALLDLIQNITMEESVREAVVRLITTAAHTTLDDPDLLDHSMEFATDVVGDDVVQQTAGEALRKSVGHAVKPATTVLLTALGVGFLIFGIVAVGYSRSSEQEAMLVESAARSLHSNAVTGIVRIATWPLRTLQTFLCTLWVRLVSSDNETVAWSTILHQVSASSNRAFRYTVTQLWSFALLIATTTSSWLHNVVPSGEKVISSALSRAGNFAGTLRSSSISWTTHMARIAAAGFFRLGSTAWSVLVAMVTSIRNQWKKPIDAV
jgi:hypothetical protein